jgi:hypothetical protein
MEKHYDEMWARYGTTELNNSGNENIDHVEMPEA